jgi:hypothetical protein
MRSGKAVCFPPPQHELKNAIEKEKQLFFFFYRNFFLSPPLHEHFILLSSLLAQPHFFSLLPAQQV